MIRPGLRVPGYYGVIRRAAAIHPRPFYTYAIHYEGSGELVYDGAAAELREAVQSVELHLQHLLATSPVPAARH